MTGCERYTALKDWLVRCSAPEKMFQRSEMRADNDGLFLALQDLRALTLTQAPNEISEFFSAVHEAIDASSETRIQRDWPETD